MLIARPRTDRVVIFRTSASRISSAVVVAGGDSVDSAVAIASVAAEDSVEIASVEEASAEGADLVASAAEADAGNYLGLECASNFQYNQNLANLQKHMKKLLTLTGIASISTVLVLLSASETTAASGSEISRKEALLAQSGFKVVTMTTPQQKEAVKGLAQGRCSAVTFNKKLFYVFPAGAKDKFYVGKQAQFDKYKKAIAAQQGSQPKKM